MAERIISHAEINLAWSVFQGRLPYHLIKIKDDLGLEGRAWTEPGILGNFIVHMGPIAYDNCASSGSWIPGTNLKRIRVVFIHELTHVWQGFHGLNYVVSSLVNQCCAAFTGGSAYKYTVGSAWSQYNAEQQAQIVDDWFNPSIGNMSVGNSRFRYIRDNIRKGLIAP